MWRPLNDNSEVAVPVTQPGSVPLPSKRTGGGGGGGMSGEAASAAAAGKEAAGASAGGSSTLSFSFATSVSEAEAAVNAQIGASAPPGAGATTVAAQPTADTDLLETSSSGVPPPTLKGSATRAKIGWDPSRVRDDRGATGPDATVVLPPEEENRKAGVGRGSSRLLIRQSAGKDATGSKADTSHSAVDGGASRPPPSGNVAKARIGWDPSRLGAAGSGGICAPSTGTAPSDTICGGKAKSCSEPSNLAPKPKRSSLVDDEGFAGGRSNKCSAAAPAAAAGAGAGATRSASLMSDPSSRSGRPTAAGRPAAAGGGGGDIALASPQQQVEAWRKVGGGIGWSASGTSGGQAAAMKLFRKGCGPQTRVTNEACPATADRGAGGSTDIPVAAGASAVRPSAAPQEEDPETQGTHFRPPSASTGKVGWNASRIAVPAPVARNTAGGTAVDAEQVAAASTTVKPKKIGWNASRVGNPAVPTPASTNKGDATPTAVEAALVAAASEKAKPKIGWNASRVGNPAVPAPTKMEKDAGVPTAAAVASAVTAAVAVAGRTVASRGFEGESTRTGQVRGERRAEVPLQLRAVLIYASTQRGIDLRKWFDVGHGGDDDPEADESGQGGACIS